MEQFINFTLFLINPGLFYTGLHILWKLREQDLTGDVAREWQSVYTGLSAISNRLTPSHRDKKGRPEWYDTLVSYSDKDAKPQLLLEDLGLELRYPTGTVVGFCGTILKHEVRAWGKGDRICFAHFMRESVRERLNVPPAGWVYQKDYLSMPLDPPQSDVDDEEIDFMDVD